MLISDRITATCLAIQSIYSHPMLSEVTWVMFNFCYLVLRDDLYKFCNEHQVQNLHQTTMYPYVGGGGKD